MIAVTKRRLQSTLTRRRILPWLAARRIFVYVRLGRGRLRLRLVALCSWSRISGRTWSRTWLLCRSRREGSRRAWLLRWGDRAKARTVYSSRRGSGRTTKHRRGRVRRGGGERRRQHEQQF